MAEPTILITGATGKQGGALIKSLLEQDAPYEILAVTRNTESPSAQALSQLSSKVKVVQGDLENPAGIFENAKKVSSTPIWGVFSVQTPMGKGGSDAEERQGKALVDESILRNVKFFVYTSVDRGGDASTDNPTNVPHFISKYRIEHHLFEKSRGTPMEWTVLRPTAFFDNIVPGFMGKTFFTLCDIGLKGKPLQFIAASDIGYFGAKAFCQPERYKGKCISLAGDELTHEQMGKVFTEKTGQKPPATFGFVGHLVLWFMTEMKLMFRWFYEHGYKADIKELKKDHPGLKDFGTWLERESGYVKK